MVAVTGTQLEHSIEAGAEFFAGRQTRAAVVARHLLQTAEPGDERLADQLIRERRRKTRLDGSMGGSLMGTAWSAWELMQLGCPTDHVGVNRMIGFLLGRQDQPGRFAEGCSDRRHRIQHCSHHMSGFFSPGPKDEPIAPLALSSGAVFTSEFEARFAASCFALRVALKAKQEHRAPVRRHIESLFTLADRWEGDEAQFPAVLGLVFCAMGALAFVPLEDRTRVEQLATHLLRQQNDEGEWDGVQLFHALDALILIPAPAAVEATRHAVPALLARQRQNGAFDETGDEELALIAIQALRAQAGGRLNARRRRPLGAAARRRRPR